MAVGHIPPTQLRSYDSAAIGVVFVKFLLYKRSLLRMDLESGIKWHLQVLPRGMTLIKIIHDPLQNNRLERNSAFSRGVVSLEVRCPSHTHYYGDKSKTASEVIDAGAFAAVFTESTSEKSSN